MQRGGAPSSLAVIGFRQIGQLEINGESLGHAISVLHGKRLNNRPSLGHLRMFAPGRNFLACLWLAILNQQAAKLLHGIKQLCAGLFNQYTAQQSSERPHVASQWLVAQRIAAGRGEFRQPATLIVRAPKRRVAHVQ